MIFSLLVLGDGAHSQSSLTALRFAKQVIAQDHSIYRIFFYGAGVYNGNALASPPRDEINIGQEWQTLAAEHNVDIVVCIASAVKSGIVDKTEATRWELPNSNLRSCMQLSGLGQLVDANLHSDRMITFGN